LSMGGMGMNIAGLLENNMARNREFPITAEKTFLAHAAASPLPRRVSTAIQDYVGRAASEGQWEFLHSQIERNTRRYAAALLGASEDEIAFVSSTSMGLSIVASGLPWREGDNVVVADGDFPSNIYPWLNLGKRGVRTKLIPRKTDGSVTIRDVREAVDSRTRLVSLSSVNFVTGFKIDVDVIGEYLQRHGILFCVDAVQSLGVAPVDVRYVDFLASSAHKWLLGPLGIGILFVKRERLSGLDPVLAGWKCVECSKDYLEYALSFLESAQRYEPGAFSVVCLVGLHAALQLLLEVGIDSIAARLASLREILVSSIKDKGYDVIGPSFPDQSSGITSFTSDNLDVVRLRQDLDDHGFVVSLRDNLESGKCIRVSPHFYNTEDEIVSFLSSLPRCREYARTSASTHSDS
jgi:cysteine desulfurase/selenocysteine lyase